MIFETRTKVIPTRIKACNEKCLNGFRESKWKHSIVCKMKIEFQMETIQLFVK
jgi:hypothetical protein